MSENPFVKRQRISENRVKSPETKITLPALCFTTPDEDFGWDSEPSVVTSGSLKSSVADARAGEKRKRTTEVAVSNFGRVKSSRGVVSYGSATDAGYRRITFNNVKYRVHILVMRAFVGPPPTDKHNVDHIDSDPSNNRLENLRWATQADQIRYSWENGKLKANGETSQARAVIVTKANTAENTVYRSLNEAAAELNLQRRTVAKYCRLGGTTRNGFSFRFTDSPAHFPNELWRPLPETGWQASSYGRLKRKNGTITCGYRASDGYCKIMIGRKSYTVHKVVGMLFLPPAPSPQHTIDHINAIRYDNRVENLRWATKKEQIDNSYAKNSRVNQGAALKKIVEYRKLGDRNWAQCSSLQEFSAQIQANISRVSEVCRGIGSSVNGYQCRYYAGEALEGEIWKTITVPFE